MSFIKSVRQQADRASLEADKLIRIHGEQAVISQLQRDIKTQLDALAVTTLAAYRSRGLAQPELNAICQQIEGIELQIRQREARVEQIRAERLAAPMAQIGVPCPNCRQLIPPDAASRFPRRLRPRRYASHAAAPGRLPRSSAPLVADAKLPSRRLYGVWAAAQSYRPALCSVPIAERGQARLRPPVRRLSRSRQPFLLLQRWLRPRPRLPKQRNRSQNAAPHARQNCPSRRPSALNAVLGSKRPQKRNPPKLSKNKTPRLSGDGMHNVEVEMNHRCTAKLNFRLKGDTR